MLRVDEAVDMLDAELAQEVAVVVLRRCAVEHELAITSGERLRVLRAAGGRERRAMARREELVVPRELHQRVVPVEKNGLDHGVARGLTWIWVLAGMAQTKQVVRVGRRT